jgi:outer membrane receptor protein involved in Fe transport
VSLLFAVLSVLFLAKSEPADTSKLLKVIDVVAPIKQNADARVQPVSSTTLGLFNLEEMRIHSVMDISAISPNFYQPDYGSKMTSSIYIRGFGSRIDQPVLGLNVDDLPCLNKNNYNFNFYDIRKVELLRGPQGTLYGRNTIGGVMNIYTLSPMVYQGVRLSAEYGSASSIRAKASFYKKVSRKFGYSAGAFYAHTDGFFQNEFRNEKCDWGDDAGARIRTSWHPTKKVSVENIASVGYTNEGGYAYSMFDNQTNVLNPVSYNDRCEYKRINISEGIVAKYSGDKFLFSSVTGYQFTNDRMSIDNDFTSESFFTIIQHQKEHALSQDFVLKSKEGKQWQWLAGAFGFMKHIDMNAPVTFKEDGIDELILENANSGIHTVFPDADIMIEENEFPIESNFVVPTYGSALYGQVSRNVGQFTFQFGARLDYESSSMSYNNSALIHYRFTKTMPNYKALTTVFKGKERLSFLEFLPKASLLYNLTNGNVYFSAAKGYKAGGFNTQIFSDILQSKMMNNLMSDLGVHLDGVGSTTYNTASATTYKPEYSWNFELGSHLMLIDNCLQLDWSAFLINCNNQQLTVFPQGKSTGRMMSNAGKSRVLGGEVSALYKYKELTVGVNYGHTNAKFVEYNDGNNSYAGNFLPYAPQNTVSANAAYKIHLNKKVIDRIVGACAWQAIGVIYWNEDNTLSQPIYNLLSASVSFQKSVFDLTLWGKNLTNESYNTFYFKSIGNNFFSKGKPLQAGITLTINL